MRQVEAGLCHELIEAARRALAGLPDADRVLVAARLAETERATVLREVGAALEVDGVRVARGVGALGEFASAVRRGEVAALVMELADDVTPSAIAAVRDATYEAGERGVVVVVCAGEVHASALIPFGLTRRWEAAPQQVADSARGARRLGGEGRVWGRANEPAGHPTAGDREATVAVEDACALLEGGAYDRAIPALEGALRVARRAGSIRAYIRSRTALAGVFASAGLFERARQEGEAGLFAAEEHGSREGALAALRALAEVAEGTGDVERALVRLGDAEAHARALDDERTRADLGLRGAEMLLDRGGPADVSAALRRLEEVRARGVALSDKPLLWRTEVAFQQARALSGDAAGALADLTALVRASDAPAPTSDAGLRALRVRAMAAASGGDGAAAASVRSEAKAGLDERALQLPADLREPFWRHPANAALRGRAPSGTVAAAGAASPGHGTLRTARVLELVRRLALETDLTRLLDRIVDAAVELSGAERGFVLLVDRDGRLASASARDGGTALEDPHARFSRSIAEAVLVDGEPLVTVDARDDARVSEFMSVHRLMLRSVACLPIRGRAGVLGVLYLEHRARRGTFEEADMDVLFAFADQAAVAIENARLAEENRARTEELEAVNAKLRETALELERVLSERTAALETTQRELGRVRVELGGADMRHGIVGRSAPMRRVFSLIDRVAPTSVSVVIHGESGTGKELVARAIHDASGRAQGPFVVLNCGAVPETLAESELFGHVRGAFTGADRDRAGVFAQANGGTLFLDEVGDMPPKMQVDLLRVLQEGRVRPVGSQKELSVDVRILAASNKSLADLVEQGSFREDLFYRLNVVQIDLPALRARRDDVPLLVHHLLRKAAERSATPVKRIAREALEKLQLFSFPGNIRQLEHILTGAVVLGTGSEITVADLGLDGLPVATTRALRGVVPDDAAGAPASFRDHKEDERRRILEALETCAWNRARAAQALDMPRRTFYRRLVEYGILDRGQGGES